MPSYVYVGPTIQGLNQNVVFSNGIPASIQSLQTQRPEITWLMVPLDQASAVKAASQTAGTPEYEAYKLLGGVDVAGSSDSITQSPTKSLSGPVDVLFQDRTTSPQAGQSYSPTAGNATLTFAIRGSSSSRTIIFEMADFSGVFQEAICFNALDPTKSPASQTVNGSNVAPESWQVDVPAGFSFRARIGAVTGGNVTITGKAVVKS